MATPALKLSTGASMPQANSKRSRLLVMFPQDRQLLLFGCASSKQNDKLSRVQRHSLLLFSFFAVLIEFARGR